MDAQDARVLRCQVFKRFAGVTLVFNGDVELPERLLFGKVVVHGDQNVEVSVSCTEQSAVPQSLPVEVFCCFHLGCLEVEPEPHRKVLTKKYFHCVLSGGRASGVIVPGTTRVAGVRRWGEPGGILGWCTRL